MVDRPVLKSERDKVKDSKVIAKQTKAEGNFLQEPKQETVSVPAEWNPQAQKGTEENIVHWSHYDIQVVSFQEANPTCNVIQGSEPHQNCLRLPSMTGQVEIGQST